LLSQVAGRAGRGDREGHVIVQTYWPEHAAIIAAATHDRERFASGELADRRELGYPPYARILRFLASSHSRGASEELAGRVASFAESNSPEGWRVLGPAPAVLAKLKGSYRTQVLVFGPEGAPLGDLARDALARVQRSDDVTLVADIDPLDLL
jgi:primosomal protein N' (replication factor Y)